MEQEEGMITNLPETSNKPEERAFKQTTRLPWKRPANKIRTVPGVMEDLTLGALRTGEGPLW